MKVFEITLRGGRASVQSVELTQIDNTTLSCILDIHWCEPLEAWVIDIADPQGYPVISGIPMITGADLLAQYGYIGFGGALLAQSDFDWTVPPTFDDLGTTGHLYWIPGVGVPAPQLVSPLRPAPISALAQRVPPPGVIPGPPIVPSPGPPPLPVRYPLSPEEPLSPQLPTEPPPVPTGGPPPPVGTATLFNNSNLVTAGPLSGVVDSNVFLCSFWIKGLTDTNNLIITHISGVSGGFSVYLSRVGSLFFAGFQAEDTFNTTIPSTLNAVSSDSSGFGHIDMSVWNHIIIAGNTNFPLGSRIAQIVVNGAPRVVRQSGQGVAFTTDFATRVTAWEFMGVVSSGRFQPGTMYDLWFGPGQFLDIDVAVHVERFRSASGNPVNLGPDGSLPTGLPPAVFCHKDCSDTVAANFANNRGTGGILTVSGNPLSVLSPCPP